MPNCGICCIEIKEDRPELSAIPALKTFSAIHKVLFKSKSVSRLDDFGKWLANWTELPPDFGILYISSHGSSGSIALREDAAIKAKAYLPQIADALDDAKYSNKNCIIHFSSCSTLRASAPELDGFRRRTEFEAVSGYRHDVGWVKALAFDLLYLEYLVQNAPRRLTAAYMEEVGNGLREYTWYGLGAALGFHIHTGQ